MTLAGVSAGAIIGGFVEKKEMTWLAKKHFSEYY